MDVIINHINHIKGSGVNIATVGHHGDDLYSPVSRSCPLMIDQPPVETLGDLGFRDNTIRFPTLINKWQPCLGFIVWLFIDPNSEEYR